MTTRALNTEMTVPSERVRALSRLSLRGRAFNLAFAILSRLVTRRAGGSAADFDYRIARARIHRIETMMASAPAAMQVEQAVGAPVSADWARMPDSCTDRVVLFVHSGSFIFGQSRLHQSLAMRICMRAQASALCVNYRLAPEHPFPTAIDDVAATYEWLLAQSFEPAQIQIVGDSAGGGIALGALLTLRDRDLPMPAAMTLLAPWADLTMSGRSLLTKARMASSANNVEIMMICRELYLQGHTPANPLASSVFADLTGLPPH